MKPNELTFRRDFQPRNVEIILDKGRTIIIAYEFTFHNRNFYNIREIYEEYDEWCPGKNGISVPIEKKDLLIAGLKQFVEKLEPKA